MAFHLHTGRNARVFLGGLETGCAWLCLHCAWSGYCVCFDWTAPELRRLDKLADRGCCSTCPLRHWTVSPETRRFHRCSRLAVVFPADCPSDSGHAFHTVASSYSNKGLGRSP